MLNWRKLALSSAVVLGMMTVAGTVYGSDDVFLNENSHMVVRDLDNATKVTWNSPLYTSNMDALNTKLGEADVRAEIIREAGFTINGSRGMGLFQRQARLTTVNKRLTAIQKVVGLIRVTSQRQAFLVKAIQK